MSRRRCRRFRDTDGAARRRAARPPASGSHLVAILATCAAAATIAPAAAPGAGARPAASDAPAAAIVDRADPTLDVAARTAIVAEARTDLARALEGRRDDPETATARFREAAAKLEVVIDDGDPSGALLYDAGTARLRARDLGRAIAHFLEARRRLGAVADLEHNLAVARRLAAERARATGGAIEPTLDRRVLAWGLGWHHRLAPPVRFGVFAAAWAGFWIVIVVAVREARRGTRRRGLRAAAALLLATWIVVGGSVGADLADLDPSHGVVVRERVELRAGNDDAYEPVRTSPLVDGTEFDLLVERAGWLEVELADGTRGWIPADAAVLVDGA